MSVKPWFWSERLLEGFGGQPPFKGCGISADTTGTTLATDNEAALNGAGRFKSKAQRTEDLRTGWRAFTRVADSNGIPDTGDMIRIHRAMFPNLPDPDQLHTRDWSEVVDRLDAGFAVSIALRLSVLPASSPLRRYTSADHQFTMYGRKGDRTQRPDPMHVHSDSYVGEWVPLAHVREAAKAIEGGLVLTWLYPIGGWTQAKLRTAQLRDQLGEARTRLATLEARIDEKTRILRERDQDIVEFKEQVAALEREIAEGSNGDAAVAAFVDIVKDKFPEFLDDLAA